MLWSCVFILCLLCLSSSFLSCDVLSFACLWTFVVCCSLPCVCPSSSFVCLCPLSVFVLCLFSFSVSLSFGALCPLSYQLLPVLSLSPFWICLYSLSVFMCPWRVSLFFIGSPVREKLSNIRQERQGNTQMHNFWMDVCSFSWLPSSPSICVSWVTLPVSRAFVSFSSPLSGRRYNVSAQTRDRRDTHTLKTKREGESKWTPNVRCAGAKTMSAPHVCLHFASPCSSSFLQLRRLGVQKIRTEPWSGCRANLGVI